MSKSKGRRNYSLKSDQIDERKFYLIIDVMTYNRMIIKFSKKIFNVSL